MANCRAFSSYLSVLGNYHSLSHLIFARNQRPRGTLITDQRRAGKARPNYGKRGFRAVLRLPFGRRLFCRAFSSYLAVLSDYRSQSRLIFALNQRPVAR